MNQKILLATNGRESSFKVEDYAMQLSGLCGAKLTIICVLDDHLCHYGEVDTLAPLEARESFIDYVIKEQQESSKIIEEKLMHNAKLYQAHFKFILQQGEPIDVISTIANEDDFDLVLVGGQRSKKNRGFRTLSFADRLGNKTTKSIITVI